RTCLLSVVAAACLSAVLLAASGDDATSVQGGTSPRAADAQGPPIRALYVTGGGFHDFVTQETIIPPGLAERLPITWTIDHTAGTSTEALIKRHETTDWTRDVDVVVYNMSFSHVVD